MKKFIPVLIVIMSILAFGGCGGGSSPEESTSIDGVWIMESGEGELTPGKIPLILASGRMEITVTDDDYDKPTCIVGSYMIWNAPTLGGEIPPIQLKSSSTSVIRTGKDTFTFTTAGENEQGGTKVQFDTNGNFTESGTVTTVSGDVFGYTVKYRGSKF